MGLLTIQETRLALGNKGGSDLGVEGKSIQQCFGTCRRLIFGTGVGVSDEGARDVRRGERISCAYGARILGSLLQNDNRVRAQLIPDLLVAHFSSLPKERSSI